MALHQTIFAASSPIHTPSAINIIRITGPHALSALSLLSPPTLPTPRHAYYRTLLDTQPQVAAENLTQNVTQNITQIKKNIQVLDHIMALHLPPSSTSLSPYPTLEFHLHGSPPLLRRALSLLSTLPSFRPARRGEFTSIAYSHNRLPGGLLGVEAFKALMECGTERERKLVTQWGEKQGYAEKWKQVKTQIVAARALVEGVIEFGETDGEDSSIGQSGQGAWDEARTIIISLRQLLQNHLRLSTQTLLITHGSSLSLFGPPNVGKSSLTNFLCKEKISLVTPYEGTTRDVVKAMVEIRGWKVRIEDTAGLRNLGKPEAEKVNDELVDGGMRTRESEEEKEVDAQREVEKMGMEVAIERVKNANVPLLLLSIPDILPSLCSSSASSFLTLPRPISDLLRQMHPDTPLIVFLNKADLIPSFPTPQTASSALPLISASDAASTSSSTYSQPTLENITKTFQTYLSRTYNLGQARVCAGSVTVGDLEALEDALEGALKDVQSNLSGGSLTSEQSGGEKAEMKGEEDGWIMNLRQEGNARACVEHLDDFLNYGLEEIVFAAEELRYATLEIERLIGEGVDTEDVLGKIFSSFCIGK